jgi:hypothetical protein
MIAPREGGVMCVPPTATRGDDAADSIVQRLGRKIAEKLGVELADWRVVANSEAAIDDLHRELAVGRGLPIADSPNIFQILD